jgi:hypothetical protein
MQSRPLEALGDVYSRNSCEQIGGHGFSQEMMTHDGVSRGGESMEKRSINSREGCQTGTYYDEDSSVYLFVDYCSFWVLLGYQQQ